MHFDPNDLDEFARLYASVTRLPELIDHAQLWRASIQNTPDKLRLGRTSARVLLSVSISETGTVQSARAIVPDLPDSVIVRGVMISETGSTLGHIPPVTTDPEIMAAAEAVARELVFRPAERSGEPVSFPDYRLSIEFPGFIARQDGN